MCQVKVLESLKKIDRWVSTKELFFLTHGIGSYQSVASSLAKLRKHNMVYFRSELKDSYQYRFKLLQ